MMTITARLLYPAGIDHDDLPPELPEVLNFDALPPPGTALTLAGGARFIVLDVPCHARENGTTWYTVVLDYLHGDHDEDDKWAGIDVRAIVGATIDAHPASKRHYLSDAAVHHGVEIMIGVLSRLVPQARNVGIDPDTITKLIYLTAIACAKDNNGAEDLAKMATLNTQLFGQHPGAPRPWDL